MKVNAIKAARVLLWFVYIWVTITLVLLFLGFILQLFGANPNAGFVEWVYRSTDRAMAPFRGIFEPITLSDKSVLDVSILFAMIVYSFVAIGLNIAIDWVSRKERAAEREEQAAEAAAAAAAGATPAWPAAALGRVVQLSGATGASATAALSVHNAVTYIDLTASGLEPSHLYDVWLQTNDGVRASAGTFQPASASTVRVSLTSATPLAQCLMVGVSMVPPTEGGVPTDVLATRL